jgi:hypothetical protein
VPISFNQARSNLIEKVRSNVALTYPTKMGTLMQQLKMIEKQGMKRPETLNGKKVPREIELSGFEHWIMNVWQELSRSRATNENGPLPLTDQGIEAWMRLMDEELRLQDIKLIKDVDKGFIDEIAVQQEMNRE